MAEMWKPLFDGKYEASSEGRIRRVTTGLILRASLNGRKRFKITLSFGGQQRTYQVASLIAHAFLGPRPLGFEVNHKDGNKLHDWADNLEYITHEDNMKHAINNLLHQHGIRHHRAKLNNEQVLLIRELVGKGMKQLAIGTRFGVSQTTISDIVVGRRWRHLA